MADNPAQDLDLQKHITDLIAAEHDLRTALADQSITPGEEHEQLGRIETELDQCWDLLRQRRAKREFGEDPGQAEARSENVVERYLQ